MKYMHSLLNSRSLHNLKQKRIFGKNLTFQEYSWIFFDQIIAACSHFGDKNKQEYNFILYFCVYFLFQQKAKTILSSLFTIVKYIISCMTFIAKF